MSKVHDDWIAAQKQVEADEKEKEENLEWLGNAEHERWSFWVRAHLAKGAKQQNGDVVLPAAYVRHLQRLCDTPYKDLSPEEQDKDKKVVYEFLSELALISDNLPECPFGPVEDFWVEEKKVSD